MTVAALRAVAGDAPRAPYYDAALQTHAVRLLPGDYMVGDGEHALVTLLGSCVAACLYDPALGVGGMNHFMLPGSGSDEAVCARYGMHAMELLINGLLKRGARRQRLVAKAFGAGNVMGRIYSDPIGDRNARFVLAYLQAEGIPVLSQDMGDICPRKVCFFPATGRALVRRLPATREAEIARTERAYYGALATAPVSGSVELF